MVVNQSKDIAFMISMAGIGVKGVDLIKKQNEDLLKAAGLSSDQLMALTSLYFQMFDLAKAADINKTIDFSPVFEKWRAEQAKTLVDYMQLKDGQAGSEQIKSLAKAINVKWMRYIIKYDPDLVLSHIKIPMLAIIGFKDNQVSASENLAGFNRLLKKAGNKDFKTMELPGLNHLFQTAATGNLDEYAKIEETISPAALKVITDWIQVHVK